MIQDHNQSMNGLRVAVMNTSKEVTDILLDILISEGYIARSAFTYEFKDREPYFDKFIKNFKPDAIIYDIAVPYQENFELFLKVSKRSSAKNIPFVLTTTNKQAVKDLLGDIHIFEIIGKPADMAEIISGVDRAINQKKQTKA